MARKLTSEIALEMVKRIEALQEQITKVYADANTYDGAANSHVIRDIVAARSEAADAQYTADALLQSIDCEDEPADGR